MELDASGFEFIILEVQLYKKEKWLICSCYKPPSIKDSVFERSFSELLNSLQIESSHILIIGDINFDMTKENTLSNICSTYDLKNLVCGPTCNKGAKSTALDVILSSEPKRFKHTINEPCFSWATFIISYNNNSLFSQELHMIFSLQTQQIWNIHHMYK